MNINVRAYAKDSIKSQVAGADSYTLIKMLMQGALDRLARAKGGIERKDLQAKAKNLSGALAIINALNESLDFSEGTEVISNIGGLYDYMAIRISDATIENSIEAITEVMHLLSEIKGGWDSIPPAEVEKALSMQAAS